MAKIKKTTADVWHLVTILTDGNNGELLLVKGGKRAYLWAGRTDGVAGCVTVTGPATLRKLAEAILKELDK